MLIELDNKNFLNNEVQAIRTLNKGLKVSDKYKFLKTVRNILRNILRAKKLGTILPSVTFALAWLVILFSILFAKNLFICIMAFGVVLLIELFIKLFQTFKTVYFGFKLDNLGVIKEECTDGSFKFSWIDAFIPVSVATAHWISDRYLWWGSLKHVKDGKIPCIWRKQPWLIQLLSDNENSMKIVTYTSNKDLTLEELEEIKLHSDLRTLNKLCEDDESC